MKRKRLCFDIDGVICKTIKKKYKSAKPIKKSIDLINHLYKKNYIIIFTARYMGRNKDSISKARAQGYKKTLLQLKEWGVNFHELRFGKPSFDLFVDDKNIFFKKNWHEYFKVKNLK